MNNLSINMMPELSIVIPVYNNANSLEILVSGIRKTLDAGFSWQLILVNDGSADNSWEVMMSILDKNPECSIRAIDLKKNYGQENAKMAGLKYAAGEFIVFMDADCQHNPDHIPALLSKCKEGFDVCYANFNNSPPQLFKRTGSWFYNYLANKLLLKPKHIYLSSYNMITKKTAEKVIPYSTPLVNIDAIVLQNTQNVTQIFVPQDKSLNTKTNYTKIKLVGLFFKLLPGFSTLPLRMILFVGSGLTFAGIVLVFLRLTLHFINQGSHAFIGNKTLFIILFGGVILMALGIIGEYIGKIYTIVNNAQQFEIQTMMTSDANDKK